MCTPAQSIPTRASKLGKQWSGVRHPGFHHPGFTSSWIAEGQSLYILKLVSRIPIQTGYLSTSFILVRVGICKNTVKRMVGWVAIPHCYVYTQGTILLK